MSTQAATPHSAMMDGIYRHQRHIYDLTRKYYLLGRDRLIEELDVPAGGSVLELGCGTGRNIVLAARRYPEARFFGLDISSEMLETAKNSLARQNLRAVTLARGDATDFDPLALFGEEKFDRIFLSYAVSMIPGWERSIAAALQALAPDGFLYVVDFGQQQRLPSWFRSALHGWLARFHVEPRQTLAVEMEGQAKAEGRAFQFTSLYKDYAWLASIGPVTRTP
ncbi:class I SAM-dependent methyltransferase [Mesorhizobium sp. SB112]|uniref:class I SAM-dependent methyltransferase n=1 Tax=Mesorhizobium sp. SB112 TaxID=3151853 RepID=UPI0032636CD6